MKTDFLILGGGIAGLTTAIALKRIGINATLVEAAPQFKPVGAGIALAANAMKVYHQLGLYDKLLIAGNSIGEMQIKNQTGKIISHANAEKFKNGLTNIAISRPELHRVLLEETDPKQIITGKRSVRFKQDTHSLTVFFDDGTSIDCNALIVAEGIHSPIRKQLLPQSETRYSGYTCWRGLADNTNLKITHTSETWGTQGRFGIVPIGKNQVYWFACKNGPANDATLKSWKQKELLANYARYHQDIKTVLANTPDDHIIWNDIADLKPIDRFAFERIVLIGDSAHATTPNMGQGACQAIEDALVLASAIQKNETIPAAFHDFETKRMARTHGIVNQSWRLGKIAQLQNPIAAGIRNLAFRLTPASVLEKQISKIYQIELPVLNT
ncbi:MAG: FAD-dependent monooxygenase [Bacteroidetes bacterium]|nr:FAD-dependent monooxygenase [Bacteroidota bacterium]